MAVDSEWINVEIERLKQEAAIAAAEAAYRNKRLELVDVPMTEVAKHEAAMEAATQAGNYAISRAGATGYYQDYDYQYTPGQGNLPGTMKYVPQGERTPTLQREQFEAQTGLSMLGMLGSLTGPRNAFQQQAVMHGANQLGLSRAVDALVGKYSAPSFQAPQAASERASPATMAEDMRRTGMAPAPAVTAGVPGASGTPASADQYLQAFGQTAPNKIVGREFARLPGDTRDFIQGGYEFLGYSPTQFNEQWQRASLPSFRAPSYGSIR